MTTTNTHAALDIVTTRSAVAIQDRPLVPLSSWLTDAMEKCARVDQAFQILTPHDARITLPLRMMLGTRQARWVVQEPDEGYYDGFTGFPLEWDGAAFVVSEKAKEGPSETFLREVPDDDLGHHLVVSLNVVHDATSGLLLGGVIEDLARALAGTAPRCWGTAEPALSRWSPPELTDLCRRRSPASTLLVFMGPHGGDVPPFGGTVQVSRVTSGVKESITFALACPADREPPLEELEDLADRYTRTGVLRTLNVQWTPALLDLTYPSRAIGVPSPLAMGIGPEGVAEIGIEHALSAEATGRRIGDAASPGLWFPLADGDDTAAWTRLRTLMEHLTEPATGTGRWRTS
ncbi:DUF6177 family protein [Actinomadura sp. NEAU-AAG7]|uniref:DUF6177 family protein n=1 Tax=Actinomadura sp. NEAU-AAG7 TaxID=2839640 RepID=UPI001BE3D8D8|nr:DUF6177 family protein [Actinomadura sp. NEAU-AAG7]MBT2210582.1 hypothetical protein [Actinomadura sp. NEAU-AAG7]